MTLFFGREYFDLYKKYDSLRPIENAFEFVYAEKVIGKGAWR